MGELGLADETAVVDECRTEEKKNARDEEEHEEKEESEKNRDLSTRPPFQFVFLTKQ